MLKFSAKDLKPVLLEARKNHCAWYWSRIMAFILCLKPVSSLRVAEKWLMRRDAIRKRMRPGGIPPGQK